MENQIGCVAEWSMAPSWKGGGPCQKGSRGFESRRIRQFSGVKFPRLKLEGWQSLADCSRFESGRSERTRGFESLSFGQFGSVVEWFMATVLKTVEPLKRGFRGFESHRFCQILPGRLVVGPRTLNPLTGVRIPPRQPISVYYFDLIRCTVNIRVSANIQT